MRRDKPHAFLGYIAVALFVLRVRGRLFAVAVSFEGDGVIYGRAYEKVGLHIKRPHDFVRHARDGLLEKPFSLLGARAGRPSPNA